MLKFIVGAIVIVLIVCILVRRRSHGTKKPWPKRLIDWLLARELAEEKPNKRRTDVRRPAKASSRPRSAASAPHRAAQDDQTSYIRPVRPAANNTAEISLSYSTEIDGNARYIPIDHLPFRVGARADCDCVLNNDTISRQHFDVFRDAYGEISVRNLSHTNGIIPIDEQTGNLEEPILEPGFVIPIDRDTNQLRFWAGELFFTLRLQTAPQYARRKH